MYLVGKIAKKTVWRSAKELIRHSKYSVKTTLLQTAFSAILPTGYCPHLSISKTNMYLTIDTLYQSVPTNS